MIKIIEKLKYGNGIKIKIGSFVLEIKRNSDIKDFPKILKKWYKKRTGKTLDLEHPKTFNEKIQWLKLYDNSKTKTKLADKYQVREWVKNKIGEEYLIPLIGVWDKFDDINFDKLPNKFVLKANHGSHWNIIVNDKKQFNKVLAKKKFDKWMKRNYAYKAGLELQYKDIKPKIIAEQFIEDSNGVLDDYKFLCFNGDPKFVWVDCGRFSKKRTKNIYDTEWNLQPFKMTYPASKTPLIKPKNYDKMLELAKKLCENFAFVRVDFYNVDGRIYFGEMTFTSMSGVEKISPTEYDIKLGNMLTLPTQRDF